MNIILETKKELYKILMEKLISRFIFSLMLVFFMDINWLETKSIGSEGINILNGIRSIIPMFLLIFSLFFIFRKYLKII